MNPLASIRGKLLVLTLCISSLPIATISTIYYLTAKHTLRRQVLEQLKAVAASKRLHIQAFMEIKKMRTADFSSDGFIQNSLETIIRKNAGRGSRAGNLNRYLAKKKLPLDGHLIAIAIADRDGKVVASTNKTLIGRDMSAQEIFLQAKNLDYGQTYMKPRHASYLAANCILSSAPIRSQQNAEALGILINAYYFTGLNDITTNRVGLGETGEAYLVNRDKVILTESRFIGQAPFQLVVDTEPIRRILEKNQEMVGIYPDYRGVPVVGTSMDIPEYGWTLLTEIDEAEVFASLKTIGVIALIIGIAGAAVAAGVGIAFATSLSRPIKDFARKAETFGRGKLDYRIEVNRRDEIGDLASSFNAMADALSKEITEHKRFAEALRKSKEQSQAILDNTSAVIYLKDTSCRYLLINRQYEKLFHVTKEEVVGKTDYDLFPKENADAFRLNDQKVLETRRSMVVKELAPHDDGMHTYISLKFPMYDTVEGLYGVCGISTDITGK
ncbi:MAG: PAS domain-containing protein [Candidatus Brocadia sp.]|uniref:histidine kinase n=1 Tax=Candidatus Brocadia fulgida TaxID=380242 RepID=A0A0M2V043_9BACT|nr:MAG: two-component sensor kinase [Candidatus Brocadia fulgida]UJS19241.1 MAG: PAS domain-containing protein [Candidatus Brocadia sp.]